jgi:hypothetical protein
MSRRGEANSTREAFQENRVLLLVDESSQKYR